jgi:hypothetical protein
LLQPPFLVLNTCGTYMSSNREIDAAGNIV